MSRSFAIGDIHGCSKTFRFLLFDKIQIKKSDKIYCLGDYIDRGADSKGVIDLIMELRENGYNIHTLRGNHEQLMIDSVKSEASFNHWIRNGGNATLESFKISSYSEIDSQYKNFFSRTKFYVQSGNFVFVHAGLNFQIPNPFTDKGAMLWIRDFQIDEIFLGRKSIIHGHTPKPLDVILGKLNSIAINIDGGCVFKHKPDLGNLIALDMNQKKIIVVKNID